MHLTIDGAIYSGSLAPFQELVSPEAAIAELREKNEELASNLKKKKRCRERAVEELEERLEN